MSGDIERAKSTAPAAPQSREVFYVNSDGEATGEIEHLKQVHLEIEQLDDSNPVVSIDMRKISADGYSGLSGIQVMLLDFGIPPRSVTISGDFQTSTEVQDSAYDSKNESSPNTLTIAAPRTEHDTHTFNVDENFADNIGSPLRRGSSMYLVHDGKPVSTRTGFLDEFDGLGVAEYGAWGHYENILKLSYERHDLVIEVLNHSQALVAYGKSIGFAERHAVVEAIPEEVMALVQGIEDEATREAVIGLHARLTQLAVEHEVTLGEVETIEALLAHNKGLLRTEKGKIWSLRNENERLRAQSGKSDTSDGSDWLKDLLNGKAGRGKTTIEQHCETIGLNPSLLGGEPELVIAAAKSMRKVWAKRLHSDISESDQGEEALKEINASVDAIIEHFH